MPKTELKVQDKPTVKSDTPRFMDVIKEVGNILAEHPDAIRVTRVQTNHGYFFQWVEAKSAARKEIHKLLKNMWLHSTDNFNYQTIADRLRVDLNDVRAVLDEDFQLDNDLKI